MKSRSLEITKEKTSEAAIFTIKGRVDSINAEVLQKHLDEALKEGQKNFILNMFQVEYLCSIGIRVIINTYKAARDAGGKLGVEQPSENVRRVLAITSLDEMLII